MHIALETWGLISLLSHAESFRGFSMFLMQRVAGNLGWTPTLGVAGDASGGGLAMACTLRARKEAAAGAPDIRVQVGSELDHVGLLDLSFKSLTCFEGFEGVEHIGTYWKILENIGKYWNILENIGKYWKILEHIGTYWKILENIGKYWKLANDCPHFVLDLGVAWQVLFYPWVDVRRQF